MALLIDETPEAAAWVDQKLGNLPHRESLGRLASAVLWTDTYLEHGEPIGGDDPSAIVNEINEQGLPLLHGHDPGRPAGRVVAANVFTSPNKTRFIAAILAYYEPEYVSSFASFGVDPFPLATVPTSLGIPVGARIELAVDLREVSKDWLREVSDDAPLHVKLDPSSYNAAEVVHELIRVALPYAALLWNPAAKTFGEQAGKDIYAGVRTWLQKLWAKLGDLRGPIVDIQAHHNGCTVSFLLRGRDIERHYAAHAALPETAAQAAKLIDTCAQQGLRLATLVYEYENARWIPSFAVVTDGRIITDKSVLIAYEQVPKGLSMGLLLQDEVEQKNGNEA